MTAARNDLTELFGGVISTYTRTQALSDGVLHAVGELASEAGFRHPVHLTSEAWVDAVAWPVGDSSQDETGRLWDVLFLGWGAIRRAIARGQNFGPVVYSVYRVSESGADATATDLRITLGPDDIGAPVFTIDTAPRMRRRAAL